ncbi:MAG: hypothetical protein ABIM89_10330 [Mycobacteriales bacterium]
MLIKPGIAALMGAVAGTVPGIIAYATFLEPEVNNDLSDIGSGLFSIAMSGAIGLICALLGAQTGYRCARRRE